MKTSCILALAGGCLACTVAAAAAQNGSRTIPRTGVPPGSHGSDDVPMADAAFEDFIVDAMKEWNLPGLSIAIVDGNKTWAKGFGYARLPKDDVVVVGDSALDDDGAPELATPSTLYYCGSLTKSVTAAALSLMVDEPARYGNVTWTTPLASILPGDFELADDWATQHMTIADALTHRTGYPRHDFAGPYGNDSLALVRALRHLPMTDEPRVRFQYSNTMYATLGLAVERLAGGTPLADFFRDRLWVPMGMRDTFLSPGDALAAVGRRLARPYYFDAEARRHGPIPYRDERSSAGAGMAISSVLDWSRYLRHMLDETGPVSAAGHAALKAPHTVSGDPAALVFAGTPVYGYGWQSNSLGGEQTWYHSGRVGGMLAFNAFVPAAGFAFALLVNTESVGGLDAVLTHTLYTRLQVPLHQRDDLPGLRRQEMRDLEAHVANCSAILFPPMPVPTSLPVPPVPPRLTRAPDLADYAGAYRDEGYGTANVSLSCPPGSSSSSSSSSSSGGGGGGGACRLVVPRGDLFGKRYSYRLEPVGPGGEDFIAWLFTDEYATVRRPDNCFRARFRLDADGRPAALGLNTTMLPPPVDLTWFERLPDAPPPPPPPPGTGAAVRLRRQSG